jgi:carboxymethylenebutenolidase
MYETRRVQHRIVSGFINIVADSHYLPAFWAHPELGGPFPGLVLIHEWWGLTAHMRTQVRRFAELGFYVVAPDLFDGQTAQNADQGLALQRQLGEAGPPRVGAALRALETHHRCNGKMAVIGWQLGGELAFHAAMHRTDLKAVIAFYARPDDYLVMMPADETPILAFYGEHDPTASPKMIERLRAALAQSPGKGQVIVYPGATTGFFNDDLPTYNAQAAADAWAKMLDFLHQHLEVDISSKGGA